MRAYRVIGAFGRSLITIGVLLLLFVAYQLWGTGLREAQAQGDLKAEFEASLRTTTTTAPEAAPAEPPPPTTAPLPTPEGEAVAILRIPRLGVEKAVVEGVGISDLKKGPGRYPDSPMPGEIGNAAIAGHRTTYGAPFYNIDELSSGDEILVRTRAGEFRYVVESTFVVSPQQVEVLDPVPDRGVLTLTTCHPRFSARQRLVVRANLEGEAVAPPPPAPEEPGPAPGEEPDEAVQAGSGQVIGGDAPAGDPRARVPALLWGLACAVIWFTTWAVSRRTGHRFAPYVVGVPVFAVTLFLCFESLARIFPASV